MIDDPNAVSPGPAAPPKDTIVEEGSALSGTLASSGHVLVRGRLEGDVVSPTVEVTETGALTGKIKAGVLRSRGALGGLLEADEIELAGRVLDHTVIRARGLAVAPGTGDVFGAQFGDCEIEVGDEPDRDRAVGAASAPVRGRLLDPDGPR
ncbi:MAG TPA: polymer-forming cytoskeletal protein [Polyangia bacterium]|nr:polymer-forming cytoskeletal protein [Polyangia bacterium]